jgi:peptide/nickel transport system substrate-binding protein
MRLNRSRWFVLLAGRGVVALVVLGVVVLRARRQPTSAGEIVLSTVASQEAGIQQLQAGQIDLFAETVSNPQLFKTVRGDPKLAYNLAWGTYVELTFNPVLNFKDGRLNPFGDPQIREAINWLIDRNYIAQEIYGGLATPKWLPLSSAFPDYAR